MKKVPGASPQLVLLGRCPRHPLMRLKVVAGGEELLLDVRRLRSQNTLNFVDGKATLEQVPLDCHFRVALMDSIDLHHDESGNEHQRANDHYDQKYASAAVNALQP